MAPHCSCTGNPMPTPEIEVGDAVMVIDGVLDPDILHAKQTGTWSKDNVSLAGWVGIVRNLQQSRDGASLVHLEWDSYTLKEAPAAWLQFCWLDGRHTEGEVGYMILTVDEVSVTELRDSSHDRVRERKKICLRICNRPASFLTSLSQTEMRTKTASVGTEILSSMRKADTIRLTVFSLLNRIMDDVRNMPWDLNPRTGLLRIGNESLAIPRQWLRPDLNPCFLESALRRSWKLTTHPIRIAVFSDERTVYAMHMSHSLKNYVSEDPFPYPLDSCHHTPENEVDYDRYGRAEREPIVDTPTGVYTLAKEMIPESWVRALFQTLDDFELPPEGESGKPESCIHDFISNLLAEIIRRISGLDMANALEILAADNDELLEQIFLQLPASSRLRQEVEAIDSRLRSDVGWDETTLYLKPFAPFALCAEYGGDAGSVTAWLLENGLSKRSVYRLRYLPPDPLRELIDDWAWHTEPDYRAHMAWLNIFLSLLHGNRHRPIEDSVLNQAAHIVTATAMEGARLPCSSRLAGTTAMRAPRRGIYCRREQEGDEYINRDDTVISMVSNLCNHSQTAGGVLARTMIKALLGAEPDQLDVIDEFLPDVSDWISATAGQPDVVRRFEDGIVGRDWASLMRGQARWHQQFMAAQALEEAPRFSPPRPQAHQVVTWAVHCDAFSLGELLVVPLGSNLDLWREGEAMENCVSTYTGKCMTGTCALFSIRDVVGGTRQATAEFNLVNRRWVLVQLRGFRNAGLMAQGQPQDRYRGVISSVEERLNRRAQGAA